MSSVSSITRAHAERAFSPPRDFNLELSSAIHDRRVDYDPTQKNQNQRGKLKMRIFGLYAAVATTTAKADSNGKDFLVKSLNDRRIGAIVELLYDLSIRRSYDRLEIKIVASIK